MNFFQPSLFKFIYNFSEANILSIFSRSLSSCFVTSASGVVSSGSFSAAVAVSLTIIRDPDTRAPSTSSTKSVTRSNCYNTCTYYMMCPI